MTTYLFWAIEPRLLHYPSNLLKLFVRWSSFRVEDECPVAEMVGVEEDSWAANAEELHHNSYAVAGRRNGVGVHSDGLLLDNLPVDALWKMFFQV